MADSVGMQDLRKEHFDSVVKGFALQEYRMKQVCMIQKSNSWTETYYKETAADLTGGAGSAIKEVPRLAQPPNIDVTWTQTSARNEKYMADGTISWEDTVTNNIPVIVRTLLRITRAVTKAVDDEIYSQISANAGNTTTISAGDEWDSATIANRDPIQNILDSIRLIEEDNYSTEKNSFILMNPKDFANLMGNANIRNAAQFFTSDVTKNGRIGRLLGLTIIKSNSVTADEAIIIVGQQAVTWKSVHGLSTETKIDTGVSWRVRAWEVGVTMVTNPNAICKISNTAA